MSDQPLYEKILFTEDQVNARINEMAAEIAERYDSTTTLFVGLLNGAQPFTAKLMSAIWRQDPYFHPNVQSMIVSRYGPNREPGLLDEEEGVFVSLGRSSWLRLCYGTFVDSQQAQK